MNYHKLSLLYSIDKKYDLHNLLKLYKVNYDIHRKSNNLSFKVNLVDSYNSVSSLENKKVDVKFKNILFVNFIGLELNIESHYLPSYTACKTKAKNVFLLYLKGSKKFIYQISNDAVFTKIDLINFDYKSIDTIVHRNVPINLHNHWLGCKLNLIFGNYKPKNIICLKLGNFFTTNLFMSPEINNFVVYRGTSPYRSSYLWKNVKPFNQKKNYLIYPATFNNSNDKNQLTFAKLIDYETVKDYIIVFSGNQNKCNGNDDYLEKTINILEKKNIKYDIHCLEDNIDSFMDILLESKALIFYGVNKVDRVRVLTEGLFANLPFIVNDEIITIPDLYLTCGYKVKNNDKKDLNNKINLLLSQDWGLKPYLLSKDNFQIDKLSENIIEQINIRV